MTPRQIEIMRLVRRRKGVAWGELDQGEKATARSLMRDGKLEVLPAPADPHAQLKRVK